MVLGYELKMSRHAETMLDSARTLFAVCLQLLLLYIPSYCCTYHYKTKYVVWIY